MAWGIKFRTICSQPVVHYFILTMAPWPESERPVSFRDLPNQPFTIFLLTPWKSSSHCPNPPIRIPLRQLENKSLGDIMVTLVAKWIMASSFFKWLCKRKHLENDLRKQLKNSSRRSIDFWGGKDKKSICEGSAIVKRWLKKGFGSICVELLCCVSLLFIFAWAVTICLAIEMNSCFGTFCEMDCQTKIDLQVSGRKQGCMELVT